MVSSLPACGSICNPTSGTSISLSTKGDMSGEFITYSQSRFFAQQNVHDIPSQKINELSAEERSEAFYDLHGVSVPLVEETPELIAEKLDDLDLEMFLVEDRTAYDLAMEINADYVRGLRLRFLRAENFDTPQAAKRMALHFDFRLNMFGKEVLGRDILLSDLPKVERELIEQGFMQVCSERDRVGRAVEIQMMRKLGREPPAEPAVRKWLSSCMPWNVKEVSPKSVPCVLFVRLGYSSFGCNILGIRN